MKEERTADSVSPFPEPPALPPLVGEDEWIEAMVAFETEHRTVLLKNLYRRRLRAQDSA